ncbi:uncharacterized protein LOC118419038 [Branchiostoma floridae]|uniref:Uncharacterized protein LOC118419038 n=1 Tax=Branchiostoma floridae TaxID=7739 RepID=A0A9J7LE24_BRAFL|nr:uncharacterized protein LOC118419038 [Branchiostoma floridae]
MTLPIYLHRQRSSDTDQATEQESTGTPCNDIQGALLSDDGEYVDTLPSMVTLQEADNDSVVYYNVPVESSPSSHQPRTSNVYENIPPAPSCGHYQELQPAVYQSLQKF